MSISASSSRTCLSVLMAPDTAEDSDTRETTCGTEEALSEALPTDAVTDETVRLLKGFANETRLRKIGRASCRERV